VSRRERPLLLALGLTAGFALSAWGLARTLPQLATAAPGFQARGLLPVLLWGLVAIACLAGLVRLALYERR
jgi:hypothetical protein